MPHKVWERVTLTLVLSLSLIGLTTVVGAIALDALGHAVPGYLSAVGGASIATIANWLVARAQNPPPRECLYKPDGEPPHAPGPPAQR